MYDPDITLVELTWLALETTCVRALGKSQASTKKHLTTVSYRKTASALLQQELRACLRGVYEDTFIDKNPCVGVSFIKDEESVCMYVTIEELRALANTYCDHPAIKTAFLFSCLTGLRRSNIVRLRW